jgi:iron complex transport system substrate-binding protein
MQTTPSPRIVSLIPSATEIVDALGYAGHLVARSHECDYPAGVERLPVLTRPKMDPRKSSAEIDRDVKALLRTALAVYEVDAEQLRALRPDVVVTQSQCEVCAVSLAEVEQALAGWTDSRPKLVSLQPQALADVWADIRGTARAIGDGAAGERLVAGLQARVAAIATRARDLPKPTVGTLEWLAPLMGGGNWVPELVELAGALPCLGEAGQHSRWLEWEELLAADPEHLIILPCGFDIARVRAELPAVTADPRWQRLAAVRHGKVWVTDGNAFFNRPGPRLVESLEILAEILHPAQFAFGHRGSGWQPL